MKTLFLANNAATGSEEAFVLYVANQISGITSEKPQAWMLLAPFGDFNHSMGIQRFQQKDAETLVAAFEADGLAAANGLPFYIGHPDHPHFRRLHRDTRAYGRIEKMRSAARGLEGLVTWSNAGVSLINERAYHGHSVNWRVEKRSDGKHHPVYLKSVGFTNEPNIPVPALRPGTLANQKPKEGAKKMPEWLKEILLVAGSIQPGASEEETREGLQTLANEAKDLRSQSTRQKQVIDERDATISSRDAALAATNKKLEAAETAFANERKERVTLVVDAAVTRGAIPTGDRESKIESLANQSTEELPGKLEELANAKPMEGFKTTPEATRKSGDHPSEGDSGEKVIELANAIQEKERIPFTAAYRRAKSQLKKEA